MNVGLSFVTHPCFCSDEEINFNIYIKVNFDSLIESKKKKKRESVQPAEAHPVFFFFSLKGKRGQAFGTAVST